MADQKTVYLRGAQMPIDEDSISSFLGIKNTITEADDAYKRNVTLWKAENLNMDMVLATIVEPGMQWKSYNPGSGRVDNGILNREARGWLKLMVCNLKPLKHETTFSMETALVFYTLMDQGNIHLGRILNKSVYHAANGANDRRLAFPVMITRMATANNPSPPPIPPPIHEQPSTSAVAEQPAAQSPLADASCIDLFKKLLRRLRRRNQDHRNMQYMIRTAFPGLEFPDVRLVSSSDSDNANYS
ncbi:hypothetical protein PIB30_081661 [Stylosanthes scabra]|uniref:Putative plant transposon protein domain-containing protein n=1 Tax=Stylosanthes scabra TaxID=79078 RepID=A0ABU6UTH8_9FABA|nr:hypothetical protein [Stylosanthes scabra]